MSRTLSAWAKHPADGLRAPPPARPRPRSPPPLPPAPGGGDRDGDDAGVGVVGCDDDGGVGVVSGGSCVGDGGDGGGGPSATRSVRLALPLRWSDVRNRASAGQITDPTGHINLSSGM